MVKSRVLFLATARDSRSIAGKTTDAVKGISTVNIKDDTVAVVTNIKVPKSSWNRNTC